MESEQSFKLQVITEPQIELIKKTILPAGSSETELQLFLHQCKRTGLDPLARQIYASKIQGKLSVITSIDGFRLIAERSGEYLGQTMPLFCGLDAIWKEVWIPTQTEQFPYACKVGIYRNRFVEPLYAVAHWSAYAQKTFNEKQNKTDYKYTWKTMPTTMLAKCAEAQALRKAFPQELSGLYTQDEMANVHDFENEHTEKQIPKRIETKPAISLTPKAQLLDKMNKAGDLLELQAIVANAPDEFKTDKFNEYVKSLEQKFALEMTKEVFDLEPEEVKPTFEETLVKHSKTSKPKGAK